jgi:hypothetical protein
MADHDDKKTYEVEPEPETPAPGRAKLEAEALLTDFDEDADFDHDPDVQAALGAKPAPAQAEAEAETAGGERALVRPGMGPWRLWVGVGVVETLAAVVLSGVYAPHSAIARGLLTLYDALLHTGTGVAAVLVGSMLLERRFGSIELATARMLAAVGAFMLVFHLPISLISAGKLEETVLAGLAYLGMVALTFRLSRNALLIVAGSHFGLWLIVQVGMQLTRWSASAGSAA